ncbi:MAG TPA: glycosyltransferase family 4 protein [Ktedonobacterales bacterium]|nr:glycosyltransferase family 4 protein [Ktedonobacterales bacterium]
MCSSSRRPNPSGWLGGPVAPDGKVSFIAENAGYQPPLRVLLVTPRYFPQIGGTETHVAEVSRRLVRADVTVTVLTTNPDGTLAPEELEPDGPRIVRVRAWPTDKDYFFAPDIYDVIMRGQWDVIHAQGVHTLVAPMAMYAAWRAGIPYVVTFHTGGDASLVRKLLRGAQWQALRPLLAHAVRLIGPSTWETTYFQRQLALPADRFLVIPNGAHHLPTHDHAAKANTTIDAPAADSPLIVSVGRLERYKGHHRVIGALPHVRKVFPGARVRVVGVGQYEGALRRLTEQLGIVDCVEIGGVPPGDNDGMTAIIRRASLVALLSEHEAHGLAALEALALGRPTLVANTTALQELARNGWARATPLGASDAAIAAAIIAQLRHPLIPTDVTLPTWDACAADLLALYRSIARRSQCAF